MTTNETGTTEGGLKKLGLDHSFAGESCDTNSLYDEKVVNTTSPFQETSPANKKSTADDSYKGETKLN